MPQRDYWSPVSGELVTSDAAFQGLRVSLVRAVVAPAYYLIFGRLFDAEGFGHSSVVTKWPPSAAILCVWLHPVAALKPTKEG